MKTLKTILLAGALLLVNPLSTNAENSIDKLIQHFKSKGYEIQNFVSNPKFKIYHNIDKIFKASPESRIKDYEEYKEKIGLEKKKKNIKKFVRDYNY